MLMGVVLWTERKYEMLRQSRRPTLGKRPSRSWFFGAGADGEVPYEDFVAFALKQDPATAHRDEGRNEIEEGGRRGRADYRARSASR